MRGNASDLNFQLGIGISEELLVALLKVLKKYLMDDSVEIIDMTSKTLRVSPLRRVLIFFPLYVMFIYYSVLL